MNMDILLKSKVHSSHGKEICENRSLENHDVSHNESNGFIRGLSDEVFEAERRLDEFILQRDRQNFIDTQEKRRLKFERVTLNINKIFYSS
jgi:hypothetical protein